MSNVSAQQQDEKARLKRALSKYSALSTDEKHDYLRRLGLLSADGRLTTRFGGQGALDVEAVEAHQREVEAAFEANR